MRAAAGLLLACSLTTCAGPAASGPIDGNWVVTSATCNGQPPNATASGPISGANQETILLAGATGSVTFDESGCQTVEPAAASYPGGNEVDLVIQGTVTCFPDGCALTCGTTASASTRKYTYSFSGLNSMTLVSIGTSDSVCTSAGQANPVGYALQRQ
jgi:hypothetical protein